MFEMLLSDLFLSAQMDRLVMLHVCVYEFSTSSI